MTESASWLKAPQHWSEEKLKALYCESKDVNIHSIRVSKESDSEVLLIHADGLCDASRIDDFILPQLQNLYREQGFSELHNNRIYGTLTLNMPVEHPSLEQLSEWIFQGDLLIFFPITEALFVLNISRRPERTPEESATEITIKGPKDGFVEDLVTNVALIRKRIRSQSLCYETITIGARTRTKVGLLYFSDILSPDILTEVRKRLHAVEVDGLYSINQLEELISDSKYSLFPLLDYTGRSDQAVASLLAGRFIIIIDGNPMVLVGPANFMLLLKSPEDLHFSFQYVSFGRLIRLFSFFISVMLPGLWVSLSAFHPDQLPFRLMATISVSRIGLPFSGQLELFILLLLLEIFREAGVRLPSSIGQTLTVVGGLIIGDAAIRAGLVSPSVVVVGALTAVAGVTLVNQSLSGAVSVIRIGMFLIASFLGMYGMLLGILLIIGYMSQLRSFGVPYLAPISPLNWDGILKAILREPWSKMKKRFLALNPRDPDRERTD